MSESCIISQMHHARETPRTQSLVLVLFPKGWVVVEDMGFRLDTADLIISLHPVNFLEFISPSFCPLYLLLSWRMESSTLLKVRNRSRIVSQPSPSWGGGSQMVCPLPRVGSKQRSTTDRRSAIRSIEEDLEVTSSRVKRNRRRHDVDPTHCGWNTASVEKGPDADTIDAVNFFWSSMHGVLVTRRPVRSLPPLLV